MNDTLKYWLFTVVLLMTVPALAIPSGHGFPGMCAAEVPDTVVPAALPAGETPRRNLVGRIIDYFDHTNDPVPARRFAMSFIGGPYYSSDVKFAVGLVASAQYRTSMADSLLQPSSASLKLQVSTTLFYSASVTGMHILPGDRMRIDYGVRFQSLPTWFWGIGYAAGRGDVRTRYKELGLGGNADWLFRTGRHLFIGPAVDIRYITARDRAAEPDLWGTLPARTLSVGAGVLVQLDTRDVATAPERGWYLALAQRFYPRWLGNGARTFGLTELTACHYRRVWKGGVLAGRLHALATYGHTPWGMMPTFGDVGMRGYYYGRYRDKCEADITLELRQHVWRRNGFVFWVGAGAVAPGPADFRADHILPNVGIGYRWEFKKRVNVRVDFGIGKGTNAFEFNINEVF